MHPLKTVLLLVCVATLLPRQVLLAGEAVRPGPRVDYGRLAFYPQRWKKAEVDTRLVPWRGDHVVFLTTESDLDHKVVGRLLGRLDRGWELYARLTGRSPRPLKQIDGKPTIAAVPDSRLTCGYGCGFVGTTGIEVAGFYRSDYPLLKSKPEAMPHYYFYEMGRNYYTFGERHSLFTTGYAVFMRYVCMDTLKCEDPDRRTRKTIEMAEGLYAESEMGFLKAFTTLDGLGEKDSRLKDKSGRPIVPSDQPVLYASAMLKLHRQCGGNDWLGRFFRQLAKCEAVRPNSKEAGVRQSLNWLVSASCAARKDLSGVFVDRWRFPLGADARRALAAVAWDDPKVDARTIISQISPATSE